jgi:hypothetical protein
LMVIYIFLMVILMVNQLWYHFWCMQLSNLIQLDMLWWTNHHDLSNHPWTWTKATDQLDMRSDTNGKKGGKHWKCLNHMEVCRWENHLSWKIIWNEWT